MRTCSKCGSPLEDDAKVCGICGRAQDDQAATQAQPKRTFKFTPVDAATTPESPADTAPAASPAPTPQKPATPPVAEAAAAPKPAAVEAKPATSEAKPATSEAKPATSEAKPATSEAKPATSEVKPATSEVKPATSEVKPATSEVKPAAAQAAPSTVKPTLPSRTMNVGTATAPETKPAASVSKSPAEPAKSQLHESIKAQPTRVMKFGGEEDKKPASPEPEPQPQPEPVQPVKVLERPIVTIAKRLGRDRRFLVTAGSLVLAMILIPYGVRHLFKPKPVEEAKIEFSQAQLDQMAKQVDAVLPDKLEWGREILRKRIPSCFPEQLLLEVDKSKPDVKYEDKAKTTISYRVNVSYHLEELPKELWNWQSVTFFFRPKNGQWGLYGERWPREDEIEFE